MDWRVRRQSPKKGCQSPLSEFKRSLRTRGQTDPDFFTWSRKRSILWPNSDELSDNSFNRPIVELKDAVSLGFNRCVAE
jgi:hypothetical protein